MSQALRRQSRPERPRRRSEAPSASSRPRTSAEPFLEANQAHLSFRSGLFRPKHAQMHLFAPLVLNLGNPWC